jgi:DNA-binding transcriptional LysR family regulator
LSLEAIAEEPSFVAAARRLGYVQSAVSQQLRALETITGTRPCNARAEAWRVF